MLAFENQNIEFKQEYVPDIRKEVMGFANAEGGTVYVDLFRYAVYTCNKILFGGALWTIYHVLTLLKNWGLHSEGKML